MTAAAPLDDASLQCGLLLESAQVQQKAIASSLKQLKAHTQELDTLVREQIRCTLVEELGALIEESTRAIQAVRALERAARARLFAAALMVTLLSGAAMALCAWRLLPSAGELDALRLRREQLTAALERLEQRGGLIDLRRCGADQRWCVRVDRKAPAYGEQADYLVVKGY